MSAATDRSDVNEAVTRDAKARGILVNDADEPDRGDVVVPSTVERGDLLLAVTTLGASPTATKRIREELVAQYGPEWEPYIALLREVRERVLAQVTDAAQRKQVLNRIAEDELLLDLIRQGRLEDARSRALSCTLPLSD